MIVDRILDLIGNTPVVRLPLPSCDRECNIYLKLEDQNPTRSVKDRGALSIIEEAERDSLLRPGGTIIESSSGNFGKSLAFIGASLGYRVIIVTDNKVPASTQTYLEALGAKVVNVEERGRYSSLQEARLEKVKELIKTVPNSFWPNQYENPANPLGNAKTTANELLADFKKIDIFIASVSTGGHLSGIAKVIRNQYTDIRVIAVDAAGSATCTGLSYKGACAT